MLNLIQYVESNFMRNLNGRTFVEFILPWNFSSTKIRLDTTWIRSYKPTLIFVLYLVSLTRPLVLSTSLSTPSILFSRSCLSESYCVLVTNSLVLGILVSIALALLTNWLYTVFLTTSLSNTLLISLLRTLGTLLIYLLLFLTSQICFWYQCRCTNACCPFQIGRHCIVRWSNRTFVFPPDCSYGSGKYQIIFIQYLSYYSSYWMNYYSPSTWNIVCHLCSSLLFQSRILFDISFANLFNTMFRHFLHRWDH